MADLVITHALGCQIDSSIINAAATLIQHYEGCATRLPDGRLAPYQDGGGVWTIGWGNTCWRDGRPITDYDRPISQAEADALFEFCLRQFAEEVAEELPSNAGSLEAAALLSLAYNIGIGNFRTSTVLKLFRAGDIPRAADAIELWNKTGGVVTKGLQRRRRAERHVFEGMSPQDAIKRSEQEYP